MRIVKLGASTTTNLVGQTALYTTGGLIFNFNNTDTYKLIVDGTYDSSVSPAGGNLTIQASVLDENTQTSSLIYSGTDTSPLTPVGNYFGFRHSNDGTSNAPTVTVDAKTFVTVNHVTPVNSFLGSNPFGSLYSVNGSGPSTTANTPGYYYDYLEDQALTQYVVGITNTKFDLAPSYSFSGEAQSPFEKAYNSANKININNLTSLAQYGQAISHVLNMPYANYAIWTTTYATNNSNNQTGEENISSWSNPSGNLYTPTAGTTTSGTTGAGQVGNAWPTPNVTNPWKMGGNSDPGGNNGISVLTFMAQNSRGQGIPGDLQPDPVSAPKL